MEKVKLKIVHKAYKFRLKPSDDQKKQFAQIAGVCRLVWNLCLEQRVIVYSSSRKSLNSYNQLPEVSQLRHEYDWIRDVPSQVLQQKVRDLDVAYKNFFEGHAEFPARKKKGKSIDSFRFPQGFQVDNRRIFLPKIGWVGFFKSQSIEGKLRHVTISRRGKFRKQLEYKVPWANGVVVAVDPKNTSRKCPVCGHTAKENRLTQADFVCVWCGHIDDADVNAAINILRAGHARLACGEIGAVRPLDEAGTPKAA
jgi:transposase